MSKMRVVVIEPGKPGCITEINDGLASMQKVVGGYIQVIPAESMPGGEVLKDSGLILVLNEEGKLERLRPNFPLWGGHDVAVGTVFVCKENGDEMVGLSEDEALMVAGLINNCRVVNSNGNF